jgi:flagellar L-ring protein precursor FlgH
LESRDTAGWKPALRRPRVLGFAIGVGMALVCAQPAPAQSLWRDESARSIVSDRRAHAVGDILTVLIQESNTATKDSSTSTSKKAGVDASIETFFYSPANSGFLTKGGALPALKYGSSSSFDGGGKINNSEKISARIAVRVVDVLPNQNLVVEGSKQISFSGETQDAVLRGVVRPEDISANNSVYSYNISDVTLKYVSKGTVSDAQRKGWFTKIWDKLTPF